MIPIRNAGKVLRTIDEGVRILSKTPSFLSPALRPRYRARREVKITPGKVISRVLPSLEKIRLTTTDSFLKE